MHPFVCDEGHPNKHSTMKKIIHINFSGRVIPFADAAYKKLQQYLETLRHHFAAEEGRDEIINDIEGRIAELLDDKTRKTARPVEDSDVEDVIRLMGRVEDFEEAGTETAGFPQDRPASPRPDRGRLYRDSADRILGGVCSGISYYLNIDPSIVRILFAIITFGGFGLGVLAYLVLWVVLPPRDLEGFNGKKLYRNPEGRVLGGVAGGLAAYFGKSARTIRLIFIAPLLLSILVGILSFPLEGDLFLNIGSGSLTGTFILVYIILWMVLPEAVSDYQKMEMRGETVDIHRIRRNVRDGLESVRGQVLVTARRGGRGIAQAIGVLFRFFFMFIAGTIAVAFFITVIALLVGGLAWWPVNDYLWTSGWQQFLAWSTLVLFLLVPLIGFILWLVRRILRVRSRNPYLGWTFGGLWVLGWVALILFGLSVIRDFRHYEQVETPLESSDSVGERMIVLVSKPALAYSGTFGWVRSESQGWDIDRDTLRIAAVKFIVRPSPDDRYHVVVRRHSFGRTTTEALERAGRVRFGAVQHDSLLDLANAYAIGRSDKFRGQHVEVAIQVPPGRRIRFDRSVADKLNALHVRMRRSYSGKRLTGVHIESDEQAFRFIPDTDYIMSDAGELLIRDGAAGQRFRLDTISDNPADTLRRIRDQLEEEKRRNEESDRRIRDLEKKLRTTESRS
ncbi:MAG: hypothetical protein RJA57_995 [Bacteroidota bacterium]